LKRIVMVGTAVAVLVCAAVAYAALNTYTAKLAFKPTSAGSAKAEVPIAWTENLGAANATSGDRAAPLTDIKTTIYGLVANYKDFPTCSFKTIDTGPKFDAACPKGSEIGTGPVHALLGGTDLSQSGTSCDTVLHVYNAGGGKAWYFFTTQSAADCGGLTTGATQPYPGFTKQVGKNLVSNVPLPPFVSTAVAGHANLYGSLITEVLTFPKLTTKVKGKTVAYYASIGCKAKSRPYTVAFTATNGTTSETKTVSGKAPC
jgi:hypothetical protein